MSDIIDDTNKNDIIIFVIFSSRSTPIIYDISVISVVIIVVVSVDISTAADAVVADNITNGSIVSNMDLQDCFNRFTMNLPILFIILCSFKD